MSLRCNVQHASDFIAWLGQVPLFTIPFEGGRPAHHEHPSRRLEQWLTKHEGSNAYYSCAAFDAKTKKKPTKADLVYCNLLQVDLDADAEHPADAILAALKAFTPEPSCIVMTGGGYQALWKLSDPVVLRGSNAQDVDVIESRNRWLLSQFKDAAATAGTWNADRLLRFPGSVNVLNAKKVAAGRKPTLTELIELNDNVYDLSDFPQQVKDATQQPAKAASLAAVQQGNEPWLAQHAPITHVVELAKWNVPNRVRELIALGLAAGKSGHDTGVRHSTNKKDLTPSAVIFDVLCNLRRCCVPECVAYHVCMNQDWQLYNDCVADTKNGKRDPHSYVMRQIEKARDKAVWGEFEQQQAQSRARAASPQSAPSSSKARSNMDELNEKHAVLLQECGKVKVLCWDKSEIDDRWDIPVLQSFQDFENRYSNRVEMVAEQSPTGGITMVSKQLGKYWLNHPKRRQYTALRFEPKKPREFDGYLNLWRGWGIEPKQGDWSGMRDHIVDILASGNQQHAEYIIKWCAWAVQNPDKPAGVALVLKGKRGTGKGVFATALSRIFGTHAFEAANSYHITGNFNAHLRTTCYLFADEAVGVADKKAEQILKAMITSPIIAIEGKGANAITTKNRLHVVMASNEDWVIPAGPDERRFAVFEVSDKRIQDTTHFTALQKHMESSGDAAMLFDLLNMDLADWYPMQSVPKTAALDEQRARSLRGADHLAFAMLDSGQLYGVMKTRGDQLFVYPAECAATQRVRVSEIKRLIDALVAMGGEKGKGVHVGDGHMIQRRQLTGYWIPSLPEARKAWSKNTKIVPNWSDRVTQEWSHDMPGTMGRPRDDKMIDHLPYDQPRNF